MGDHHAMEVALREVALRKLPNDIWCVIGEYIGEVTRAKSCSVSTWWYTRVLAVSAWLSPAPELYMNAPMYVENAIVTIFKDYHLTVRFGRHMLGGRYAEMCTAGNRNVCGLFILNGYKQSNYAIFATDSWFWVVMRVDLSTAIMYEKQCLLMYLFKHNRGDVVTGNGYLACRVNDFNWNKFVLADRLEIVNALMKVTDSRIVTWIMEARDSDFTDMVFNTIIGRDVVDLASALFRQGSDRLISRVCGEGSVAMLEKIRPLYPEYTNEDLLELAFNNDNLTIFDHLVSIGVDTSGIDFLGGIISGCYKCALRILPCHINTHEVMNAVVEYENTPLGAVIDHFAFTTDDFNYGLRTLVTDGSDPEEFLPYATNYDTTVYKKYGVVIVIDHVDETYENYVYESG